MSSSPAAQQPSSIPSSIELRSPSAHTLPPTNSLGVSTSKLKPPAAEWLTGTWQVTHSTLPMWKGKCNVRITYTPLPNSHALGENHMSDLDDLVEYQSKPGNKPSSVHGVSRVADVDGLEPGLAFSWRGRGWLMIASSKWEILGWGEDNGVAWVVTYFSKTIFTPAGIDVYCRDSKGLKSETLVKISDALKRIDVGSIQKLGDELFPIPTDSSTNKK